MAAVRARGVTVFDPEGPAQLPAPGTVHVVVVTKGQMDRCGSLSCTCRRLGCHLVVQFMLENIDEKTCTGWTDSQERLAGHTVSTHGHVKFTWPLN